MKLAFKNNSKRLEDEYDELEDQNPELFNIITDLAYFVEDVFDKTLVITMIYRTKEEQDYLYRNDERHKIKPRVSVHQLWMGVDFRSYIFDKKEIEIIENYINKKYNPSNYYKYTIECHDIGAGDHLHLQFAKK